RSSHRTLTAMEAAGPAQDLPEPPYDRYFLREYARYLGVADEPLIATLDASRPGPDEQPLELVPFERPPRRWPVWALVVLSAAAVATLAVVRVGPDKGQPAASSVLPVPRSTQAPLHQAPSPSAPVVHGIAAVLRLSDRCWIEATVDGTVMPGQVFLPGKPLR